MVQGNLSWLMRFAAAWALILFSAAEASTHAVKPIVSASASASSIGQRHAHRKCLACINQLRGGAPSYESNPNYQHSAPMLGDVDKDGFYRAATFQSPLAPQRPPPLTELVKSFFAELHRFSPTLFNGTIASIALFVLWQLPTSSSVSKLLRNHFMCSQYNIVRKRRYHALVTAAFSHSSFHHIAVNMYAFVTFGRSVKQILARNGIPLGAFVLSAAVFGNLVFLAFDGGQGSCVGLSGVTLALLAFDALVYPTKELRLIVSFIPITLQAYYLFVGLCGFSVLGIFGVVGRSNVAHSTHLGGLVFGALFYEALKRGWLQMWIVRVRKAYRVLRGS